MNDMDTRSVPMPSTVEMERDMGLRNFLLGIYQKMALGLVMTGAMAWAVANTPSVAGLLYNMRDGYITGYTALGWIFAFAPLGLSFISGRFMNGLDAKVSGAFYWVFVAVMGVSLSSIFLLYTGISIANIFFITAATFGVVSLIGYTTKVNMTGWGGFFSVAVLGLIIAGIANAFIFKSGLMMMAMSAIGVLLFSALIAYQTQSLKRMYYSAGQLSDGHRAALTYIGAIGLYVSFINLFLSLLNLFGGRR
ncbi:MAG: Bax inhibitor-1/YccA family protein [Asticcacaulis sp.]